MDHPTDIIPLEIPETAPSVNELIRLLDRRICDEINRIYLKMRQHEAEHEPCSGHNPRLYHQSQ